jgi:cellulose synthase/poly-beta-1,6-N-acetylglucosamine synthase-like glycosyltransferase
VTLREDGPEAPPRAAGDGRPVPEAVDELVSVIVPARNEERAIGATLDALRAQSYHRLQILVVDGDSTDGTVRRTPASSCCATAGRRSRPG